MKIPILMYVKLIVIFDSSAEVIVNATISGKEFHGNILKVSFATRRSEFAQGGRGGRGGISVFFGEGEMGTDFTNGNKLNFR